MHLSECEWGLQMSIQFDLTLFIQCLLLSKLSPGVQQKLSRHREETLSRTWLMAGAGRDRYRGE